MTTSTYYWTGKLLCEHEVFVNRFMRVDIRVDSEDNYSVVLEAKFKGDKCFVSGRPTKAELKKATDVLQGRDRYVVMAAALNCKRLGDLTQSDIKDALFVEKYDRIKKVNEDMDRQLKMLPIRPDPWWIRPDLWRNDDPRDPVWMNNFFESVAGAFDGMAFARKGGAVIGSVSRFDEAKDTSVAIEGLQLTDELRRAGVTLMQLKDRINYERSRMIREGMEALAQKRKEAESRFIGWDPYLEEA